MNKGKINLQTKKLADLVPADYNPRAMTDKQRQGLSNSIDEFGLVEPIVWNEATGNVVGGHQRLNKLSCDGVMETDVVVVDLDVNKEKALNIALNHQGISGDFTDTLQDVLDDISDDMKVRLNLDELSIERWEDLPEIVGDTSLPDAVVTIKVTIPREMEYAKDEMIDYIQRGITEHWDGHDIKVC